MKLLHPIPLLLGLALGLHAAEPKVSSPDIPASLHDWLGDLPGGVAVALVERGEPVSFHAVGRFSATDPRPVTADTQFEIGSLTKVFTSILLADAVHEKRLTLDASVGPPFAASKVSYEQLATHTSGLPRLPIGFASKDPANPYREHDLAILVEAFNRAAIHARPAAPEYSNFGYAVLGQAVAGAWAEPYAALLHRRVLEPLGLRDTVTDWRDADRARLAPGHDEKQTVPNWDFAAYAPIGSLVSTVRDLSRFLQACLATDPAAPLHGVLEETLRPRGPGEGKGSRIGLAWQIIRQGPVTVCWHNGATGGYRSFLALCPETGRGIVLLTNHNRDLDALGVSLLAGIRPAPPEATAPELLPYLGDYPLSPAFSIAVTATGNDLFIQATRQPKLRLKRLLPDRYAVEGVKAEIVFERDAAGAVSALVLEQNGARKRGPRQPPQGGK